MPGGARRRDRRGDRRAASDHGRPLRRAGADSGPAPAARPWRPRARRSGPTSRAPCRRVARAPSASAAPAPDPRPARAAAARASASAAGNPRPPTAARPQAPHAQPTSSSLPTATVFSSSIRPASSTATAVTDCLCTSTPITIIYIASSTVGGDRRADRPQSRRKPRSYQVTLDGLGTAAATQRSEVSSSDIREWSQPPPARVCAAHRTPPGRG